MKPFVVFQVFQQIVVAGVAWSVLCLSPSGGLAEAAGQSGGFWGGSSNGLHVQSSALQEAAARTSPARGLAGVHPPAGSAQQSKSKNPISAALESAGKKIGSIFTPKRKEPAPHDPAWDDDPTALNSEARPSAQLYLALARLAEQNHRWQEAESHYGRLLKMSPDHIDGLLGLARLKDNQRKWPEADQLYQRAIRAHPQRATVYNDYGLSLARRGQFTQAVSVLERAVKLEPRRWLYRNNIAMVLVQLGQTEAALRHLRAVQPEAVACYNVGYMLQRRGDRQAAAAMFAKALESDPTMAPAKARLDQLRQQLAAGAGASQQVPDRDSSLPRLSRADSGVSIAPRPAGKPAAGPETGAVASPPRSIPAAPLPPAKQSAPSTGMVGSRDHKPATPGPSLTPGTSQAPAPQTAPLPPPIRNAARPWHTSVPPVQPRHVRPLPPVRSTWRR